MTLSHELTAELGELIDAVCEQRVTPADVAQLEQLLGKNPTAQWFYLERVHLHGSLRWQAGDAAEWSALKQLRQQAASGGDSEDRREDAAAATAEVTLPAASSSSPPIATNVRFRPAWFAALAAGILIAVGLGILYLGRSQQPEAASATVRLAQAINAQWDSADQPASWTPPVVGDGLPAGRLRLAAGLARIDFPDGASMTLEGPADFSIVGTQRAILHRGRLTAKAPPQAIGFRIDTARLHVVDLGTVFGVAASEDGAAEVVVFDGEVAVALPEKIGGPPAATNQRRLLAEGTAARVTAGGARIEDFKFSASGYERTWPVTYGVLQATGVVKFVEPAPFITPRTYEDDNHLVVFPERDGVVLTNDMTVAVREPGRHEGSFDPQAGSISAGTRLRSYLMQFNPVGRDQNRVRAMEGSVTFDHPILGLICTTKQLTATDALFGADANPRAMRGGGGIEQGDTVTLSDDRRTLTVRLTASSANDQIRVFVDSPLPSGLLAANVSGH